MAFPPKKAGAPPAEKNTKKFPTVTMAKAMRNKKAAPDPEQAMATAMQRGGYSKAGGGIGSG